MFVSWESKGPPPPNATLPSHCFGTKKAPASPSIGPLSGAGVPLDSHDCCGSYGFGWFQKEHNQYEVVVVVKEN